MGHGELGMGNWDFFTKYTMGKQMGKQIVRAADSICANISEGRGRNNHQDNRRFIKIARGSLYETISWLRLAYARQLLADEQVRKIQPIIDKLPRKLNDYLNSIGCNKDKMSDKKFEIDLK